MLTISINATNIELTESLDMYTKKRLETIEKRIKEQTSAHAFVELSRTTNHHKQGNIYRAEIKLDAEGQTYFVAGEQEDLYAAIDEAKDMLTRELSQEKDKKNTLYHRGARSVKKMMKGISNRNPFTSKY